MLGGQKIEHIEHCGFPAAVGAEQDHQRCKILEFNLNKPEEWRTRAGIWSDHQPIENTML